MDPELERDEMLEEREWLTVHVSPSVSSANNSSNSWKVSTSESIMDKKFAGGEEGEIDGREGNWVVATSPPDPSLELGSDLLVESTATSSGTGLE